MGSSNTTSETTHEKGEFLNIFSLTKEQQQELRERTEAFKGTVRVVVHPYFINTTYDEFGADSPKNKRIATALSKWAAAVPSETPPIIIFEEQTYGDRKLKKECPNLRNKIYIVPTYAASPEPIVNELMEPLKGWESLRTVLRDAHAEKVIVGGTMLSFIKPFKDPYEPDKDQELMLAGCVSGVVHQLEKDFKIEISTLTYPEARREVREKSERMKY